MSTSKPSRPRLAGLDLARFLALVGMVIVNFDAVMVGVEEGGPLRFAELLQGRAAATFVVLAGLGFGLADSYAERGEIVAVTLRRIAFLFVLGLGNMLIFPPDIIHYYAFYFLFGLLFLNMRNRWIAVSAAVLTLCFPIAVGLFNYDAGWDWKLAEYAGLWTVDGFLRNLFFNGWHPILPWLAFFLVGLLLSRLELRMRGIQLTLLIGGVGIFAVATLFAAIVVPIIDYVDPEMHYFFTTEPIPPMPLFIVAGTGAASAVIGFCLLAERRLIRWRVLGLVTPAGRQTLTLYIAHIFIGMGIIEEAGLIGGQSPGDALQAALIFCVCATAFAFGWSRFFRRGPLEALMRRITG